MNFDFLTPYGVWNPLFWILIMIILLIISYLIWSRGEKSYKKDTEQTEPFLSGYAPDSEESLMVKASNIYWGFTSALKRYYKILREMHTGDIRDYVGWYIGIMAMMIIIYILWGGA